LYEQYIVIARTIKSISLEEYINMPVRRRRKLVTALKSSLDRVPPSFV